MFEIQSSIRHFPEEGAFGANALIAGSDLFFEKKYPIKKTQSNYFAIFNYFTQNSTYMKKGSFTSKLNSSFFIQSKFMLHRQGQLPSVWIHYCRFLPRGGGCHHLALDHRELML